MSRSGYDDDYGDNWSLIRWRGAVASAIRGKNGQAFMRELLTALEALPKPELIKDDLVKDGAVCALGAVGKARGLDMSALDPEDREIVAAVFKIPYSLACEIMYENDELWNATPASRFEHMKRWAESNIKTQRDEHA